MKRSVSHDLSRPSPQAELPANVNRKCFKDSRILLNKYKMMVFRMYPLCHTILIGFEATS